MPKEKFYIEAGSYHFDTEITLSAGISSGGIGCVSPATDLDKDFDDIPEMLLKRTNPKIRLGTFARLMKDNPKH